MADNWSKEKRSEIMGRIRSRNTKPELLVRSMLHRLGFRFTVNAARNRNLPGRPDIVLPGRQAVVLVHGCFWHAHKGCRDFKIPKTRTEWWTGKFQGNIDRDRYVQRELRKLGWQVIVVWECSVKRSPSRVVNRLEHLLAR